MSLMSMEYVNFSGGNVGASARTLHSIASNIAASNSMIKATRLRTVIAMATEAQVSHRQANRAKSSVTD